jgi:hypothetical protein
MRDELINIKDTLEILIDGGGGIADGVDWSAPRTELSVSSVASPPESSVEHLQGPSHLFDQPPQSSPFPP